MAKNSLRVLMIYLEGGAMIESTGEVKDSLVRMPCCLPILCYRQDQ